MTAVKKPQSLEEVTHLELALDDYLSGVDTGLVTLEYIDRFRKATLERDDEMSFEAFSIVQTFVNCSYGHLKVPPKLATTLEYYNNRPLRQLVLESLDALQSTTELGTSCTMKLLTGYAEISGKVDDNPEAISQLRGLDGLDGKQVGILNYVEEMRKGIHHLRNILD